MLLLTSDYIKKQRTPIVDGFWRNRILNLCKQLKIKKTVLLFESEIVKIPVVMWHLKPIIFIPVGLLINLTAGEVEAVLLHELAHIRRNDYLVNIIQVIAESIFFFNPALLWMSNLLREEREHCCDDIAVAHTKSKKRFIQALISFKESSSSNNSIAMAFPGSKNQLLRRVSRIIYNRNSTLDGVGKSFVLGSLVLLALLTTAATNSNKIFQGIKTVKKEVPFIKPKPAEQAVLEQAKIPVAIIKSKVVNKRIPRRQNIVIAHDNLEINRLETNLKSAVSKAYDQVVTEDKEMAIASGEGQIAELSEKRTIV
ncbi:MAG: M56 family metallopeptidase [Segetibacter sp.]